MTEILEEPPEEEEGDDKVAGEGIDTPPVGNDDLQDVEDHDDDPDGEDNGSDSGTT